MITFDENNPQGVAQFVLDNLPRHTQFVLGTTDATSQPWVVCLNLTFDDDMNIIWKSVKGTEHSKHLAENNKVSICVFSETPDIGDFGFYTIGYAHEVIDPTELEHCINERYTKKGKPTPGANEFTGESSARLYIAKLESAWANETRHIKTPVDLELLRKL